MQWGSAVHVSEHVGGAPERRRPGLVEERGAVAGDDGDPVDLGGGCGGVECGGGALDAGEMGGGISPSCGEACFVVELKPLDGGELAFPGRDGDRDQVRAVAGVVEKGGSL